MRKKLIQIFVAVLLVCPTVAAAQIGYDTSANTGDAAVPSATVAITVGSGSNRLLVCGLGVWKQANPAPDVSSVSSDVDGAFTLLVTSALFDNSYAAIYYLKQPTVGAHTITATLINSNTDSWAVNCTSLNGVDQTTPFEDNDTAGSSGGSTAPSVTSTTVTADAWVFDVGIHQNSATVTMDSGTNRTERMNQNLAAWGATAFSSTKGPVATPAGQTMSWTLSASNPWAIAAGAIKPAAGGGGGGAASKLPLVGVGCCLPLGLLGWRRRRRWLR